MLRDHFFKVVFIFSKETGDEILKVVLNSEDFQHGECDGRKEDKQHHVCIVDCRCRPCISYRWGKSKSTQYAGNIWGRQELLSKMNYSLDHA